MMSMSACSNVELIIPMKSPTIAMMAANVYQDTDTTTTESVSFALKLILIGSICILENANAEKVIRLNSMNVLFVFQTLDTELESDL